MEIFTLISIQLTQTFFKKVWAYNLRVKSYGSDFIINI